MTKRSICLAAGGTGGHVFPAIAVAETLRARGHSTCLFTDQRGASLINEVKTIPANLHVIMAASPFQKGVVKCTFAATKILIGAISSFCYLLLKRPTVIIGFGGYPSFGPLLAGRLLGIPIMLHEQNAFLGRANHILVKLSKLLALSWPQTKNLPNFVTGKLTGLPVRQAFYDAANANYYLDKKSTLNLTVFGGSQGASILSILVPDAIAMLDEQMLKRLKIHQQARIEQIDGLSRRYEELGVTAKIKPFFSDVPKLLSDSHLVICRAGASSVAELAAIGRPSLLLPLPNAMDDHQRMNAMQMQDAGGGICLDEKKMSAAVLANRLMQLLESPKKLSIMARRARSLAKPSAANNIAALAENLMGITPEKELEPYHE